MKSDLVRRWPTALALLLAAGVIAAGSGDDLGDAVSGYADALPLLPLLYVVIAQLGRPRLTWPVLGAGVVLLFGLGAQDAVPAGGAMIVVALAVLLWGMLRGSPHGGTVLGVQVAGAVGFGALAVAGLVVDADLGRYLVAAGWFGHGVWDLAHLRLARLKGVVAPTFAEWCAVVDIAVAVELLFLR
jgi:hypothetical protein